MLLVVNNKGLYYILCKKNSSVLALLAEDENKEKQENITSVKLAKMTELLFWQVACKWMKDFGNQFSKLMFSSTVVFHLCNKFVSDSLHTNHICVSNQD